ncbi:hypothetical protein DA075_09945 [Methylobacterium currus]|uniref:Uncharacterized protein n=1 Tax=Methylobacterium currus TaxID=2051553 RepID=A0A2R4WI23_9HYPH|nr:hypothetical protein DA075_09945 [Methylobacterium currus]
MDFDSLNALFERIPSGPWDARRDTDGHEIRQIDTDPTNKHHWPFRLCRSIPGQRAGCDDAVFDFLAGVLNAWPQIVAAHSEEAEIERILAMPGDELDARLRLEGRDPEDVVTIANQALRIATMQAALETISSQYVTNRGDMTAEEALAAIKNIADRARNHDAPRDDQCQCGACTSDVAHASDCAVHAGPASPSGSCTCNAPGMEAEGRDASAARDEVRQPADEVGAPQDVPQADPSSEIEGLIKARDVAEHQRNCLFEFLHGASVRLGVINPDVACTAPQLMTAMEAYFDHLQSTPSPQGGTVGRDPQQVHDTNSNGEATGRDAAHLEWAVSRWNAEVANRPVRNVHRRALDDTWRQAIRRFGGDPDALVGPSHDALIAEGLSASPRPSHEGMSEVQS